MAVDGQVLLATGVAHMRADIEDDGHVHRCVASAHIIVAMSCFVRGHLGIADLPEHLDVFALVADRHLANLAHDAIVCPAIDRRLVIYEVLEVELRASNLRIDKGHFVRLKTLYSVRGPLWIEEDLSVGLVKQNRRRNVKHYWRECSMVTHSAP